MSPSVLFTDVTDQGKAAVLRSEPPYLVLFAVNFKHRYSSFSVHLISWRMLPHTFGLKRQINVTSTEHIHQTHTAAYI